MTRNIRIALLSLIVSAALLSGCSSYSPLSTTTMSTNNASAIANKNRVKQTLYTQYNDWKSVKYKNGGLSKRGIDCSGFVYLTYDKRFGIELPRSTDGQVHAGPEIPQRELEPGDLVFFKTGRTMRHVGIYIEDRKFLHVSTEKGVMISSLDDTYWSHRYWKSVRIKDKPNQANQSKNSSHFAVNN